MLLVVDNSGSMIDEQLLLSSTATNIIDGLDTYSTDYSISVITTDSAIATGIPVTPFSTDPVGDLSDQIMVGINGSANEMGIWASITATSSGGFLEPSAGLMRLDATFVVVWLFV